MTRRWLLALGVWAMAAAPAHAAMPAAGTLEVTVVKLHGAGASTLVSTGVPFAPGVLAAERDVAILQEGRDLNIGTRVLARWPQDGSIRSLLVQFPLAMPAAQARVTLQWGRRRSAPDIGLTALNGDFPEAILALPPEWLCDSQVLGPQAPRLRHKYPEYDQRLFAAYGALRRQPKTGDIREDGYYSTPHALYQLYVRTGDPDIFIAARRELLAYRDGELVREGPRRGGHKTYPETRYVYVEALADDYLLTGDERSRIIAAQMAEYLVRAFPPAEALVPRDKAVFWTEREAAFPFLGVLACYEITGSAQYLALADSYMANLYKTQQQWPGRGGFIHNLYKHDTTEKAQPDEWGGSPFMTGLLLEAVVAYHRLTGSETAAASLFLALDWLKHEALAPDGASFQYLTAAHYRQAKGAADLNLLIAHAFGYGALISEGKRQEYAALGERLFLHGVKQAYLDDAKHFNQNARSSGHFLAYMNAVAEAAVAQPPAPADLTTLAATDFEAGLDGWMAPLHGTRLELDAAQPFKGARALRIERAASALELAAARRFEQGWVLTQHPRVRLAYRIPPGVSVGLRCLTRFGDWITLGGTAGEPRDGVAPGEPPLLQADGAWHALDLNAAEAVQRVLPRATLLTELQFYSGQAAQTDAQFWIDDFSITQ